MTNFEIILIVINRLSFVGLAVLLPLEVYGFFAGEIRHVRLLEKINISPAKYKAIGLILTFSAFITYIVRDLIFNS